MAKAKAKAAAALPMAGPLVVPLAAGGAGVIPALPAVTNLTGHLGGNMVHLGVHAAMGQTLFILGMDALDASSPGNAIVEAPEIRIRTVPIAGKGLGKGLPVWAPPGGRDMSAEVGIGNSGYTALEARISQDVVQFRVS